MVQIVVGQKGYLNFSISVLAPMRVFTCVRRRGYSLYSTHEYHSCIYNCTQAVELCRWVEAESTEVGESC